MSEIGFLFLTSQVNNCTTVSLKESIFKHLLHIDFKGHCHKIFDPRFFSSNFPPLYRLKLFRIWRRIRREILEKPVK
jgi:hypothetical protein